VRARILIVSGVVLLGGLAMTQAKGRLNPVIELAEANKPIYVFYAPANPGGGRRGGAPDTIPRKTNAQLAADGVAYKGADGLFNGGMESGAVDRFDAAFNSFAEFAQGMAAAGVLQKSPGRLSHPVFVKTAKISDDTVLAAQRIARQLNLGVSGIVFVSVESAQEVKQGLAMMRFKSKGGVRPDDVGNAPAFWGMSEKDYKTRADVWPLSKDGELLNWTIVESKAGVANLREIAAVKGIGALFAGGGTLRGVYPDTTEREAVFRQFLAACKEFSVPCGFPISRPADMERRMKEGWSVFIINWGEQGFAAADTGRAMAARAMRK
jgi:2-keto-3-deoxy-L-rhamnonate aldolase RhmA